MCSVHKVFCAQQGTVRCVIPSGIKFARSPVYLTISNIKNITNSSSSVSRLMSVNDSNNIDAVVEIISAAATGDAAQACIRRHCMQRYHCV